MTPVKHVNFVRRGLLATLPSVRLSTEPWSERGAAVIIVNHPLPSFFILVQRLKRKERKKKSKLRLRTTPTPPQIVLQLYNRSATFQKRHPLPPFLSSFLLVVSRSFNGGHVSRRSTTGSLTVSKNARENSLTLLRNQRQRNVNLVLKIQKTES